METEKITTQNCGLYLENDSTVKFKDWRERMNGTGDSNMVKIDAALGEKQDRLHGVRLRYDSTTKTLVVEEEV